MSVSPFRKPTVQHFWKGFALLWFCIFAPLVLFAYMAMQGGDVCSQKGLLKTETEETFSLNFLCGNLHVKDTVGFLCSITRTRGRKQSNKIHRFYKVVCQVNYQKIKITVVYT